MNYEGALDELYIRSVLVYEHACLRKLLTTHIALNSVLELLLRVLCLPNPEIDRDMKA